MLKQLFSKRPAVQPLSTELDYNKLPVLTAEQLIQFTGQQNRIRSIKRIVKIDEAHFQKMYLDVIYNFAEMVQLIPASQAHHHAVPGGLFIHTLEVIEQAMSLRQQYKLPAFAAQEVQERERHAWTYGVFAAAILHDLGKRVTMCLFETDKGNIHSAFDDRTLPETGAKHYRLIFQDPKYYAMHEEIGVALIDVIPSIGKVFLFNHLNIIKEMIAYIHGNTQEAGMIGEIIRKADQRSTGQSLAHTPTRKFKGASLENMGERLMTQLRQMIASNDFVVNKGNANIYTSKDGYTYCVSKVIVDGIREELAKNKEIDIPTDNNRIFDTFQEYGFLEPNPRTGQSIHYICIYHNGKTRTFTVLKFKTEKLFRTIPQPFEGVIEEVANRQAVQSYQPETEREHSVTETKNKHSPTETERSTQLSGAAHQNNPQPASEHPPTEAVDNPSSTPEADNANPPTETGSEIQYKSETGSDMMGNLLAQSMNNPTNETPAVNDKKPTPETENLVAKSAPVEIQTEAKPQPTTDLQKSPELELAENFLAWCRKQIIDRNVVINESSGMLQKLQYKKRSVIAITSPRGFTAYAEHLGWENPEDKKTISKIQNACHNNQLNIRGPKGQIVWLRIKKSDHNPMNGYSKFCTYLFEVDTFVQGDTECKAIIDDVADNTNLAVL